MLMVKLFRGYAYLAPCRIPFTGTVPVQPESEDRAHSRLLIRSVAVDIQILVVQTPWSAGCRVCEVAHK